MVEDREKDEQDGLKYMNDGSTLVNSGIGIVASINPPIQRNNIRFSGAIVAFPLSRS